MSGQAPVLSVVIPVYNAQDTIREALDSLLNQSLKEIEVICVDDGSTDTSAEIAEAYAARDPRVSLIRQQNKFAGAARNAGIDAARGEWIFFLDADDYVLDYALEAACRKARRHRLDCLRFMSLTFDEREKRWIDKKRNSGGALEPGDFDRLVALKEGSPLLKISVAPWAGICRREFLAEKRCRFNGLRAVNDRSFFNKVITNAERIMISRDRVTAHRVNQDESLVGKKSGYFDCQIASLLVTERQMKEDGIPPEKALPVMRQEFEDLAYWYRRFSGDEERKAEMDRRIEAYCGGGETEYGPMLRDVLRETALLPPPAPIREVRPFHEACGKPAVTVIVPAGDAADTLHRTLDSLTNQTLEEMAFLVVNAGCPEEVLAIAREYAAPDKRFTVISRDTGGSGEALNAGLDEARGRYAAVMKPGDYAEPALYERLYRQARRQRADLILADFLRYRIAPDGKAETRRVTLSPVWGLYRSPTDPGKDRRLAALPEQIAGGMYALDFLREHQLRFREAAEGPQGEDAFRQQALGLARRVSLSREALYLEQARSAEAFDGIRPETEEQLVSSRLYRLDRAAGWLPGKIRTGAGLVREQGLGTAVKYGREKAGSILGIKGGDSS